MVAAICGTNGFGIERAGPTERGHQRGLEDRRQRQRRLRVGVTDDDGVIGDDPLVNGMSLSIRLRRDFTVVDGDRLLAAARRAYRELNPGTSAEEACEFVSCAADALFVSSNTLDCSATRSTAGSPVTPPAGWKLVDGVHKSCSTSRNRCLLGPEATVCGAVTSSRFHRPATTDLVRYNGRRHQRVVRRRPDVRTAARL